MSTEEERVRKMMEDTAKGENIGSQGLQYNPKTKRLETSSPYSGSNNDVIKITPEDMVVSKSSGMEI